MKIVGVSSAEAGDGAAGLSPRSCEFGVGVDDAADLGKFAIKQQVGIEVAGRVEGAFDDFPVQRSEHEVGFSEGGIAHAAGFDRYQRAGAVYAGAVDAACVAKSVDSEASAGDLLIGPEHLGAKLGQQHGISSCICEPAGLQSVSPL
jgi:hypothetical protein